MWGDLACCAFMLAAERIIYSVDALIPILVPSLASLSVPFLLRLLYWYHRFETPIVFLYYISIRYVAVVNPRR